MRFIHLRLAAFASVSIALCGCASAASAQDASSIPGYYITGDGGVSFLPNLKLKSAGTTQHEKFDTGYAYGGGVGYDTGDGVRIELDSTHQMSNLTSVGGAAASGHLQSTNVMANAQVDLLHHASVTPYLGAGIGYQNVGVSVNGNHDSDWKPGYQAEAGLRTNVSDNVSLFGEYRFSQSEAADLSDAGFDAHQHFADHGVMAGLSYKLGQ